MNSYLLVSGVVVVIALVYLLFYLYTPYQEGAEMKKCEHEWVLEEEPIPVQFVVFQVCKHCAERRTRPDIVSAYKVAQQREVERAKKVRS